MKTFESIQEVLGVTEAEVKEVIKNKNSYYYSFPIQKRNGKKRYLDAPTGKLKEWQNIITNKILYKFGPHPIACGFAKGRNQIMAAVKHTNKDLLIAMDIKNFFNSITAGQLVNLFNYLDRYTSGGIWKKNKSINNEYLIELLTYNMIVPQGAPSSPALSNLYMLRADKLLKQLADNTGTIVSRYADDIVFSGNKVTNNTIDSIIKGTKAILKKYKLNLNPKKIHINRKNKRMCVVGIVVNEKTNISRETWRNFRAELHNLKVSQKPVGELEAQILRGKIEWYKSLNPKRGQQFLKEFGFLNFIDTLNTSMKIKI